MSVGEAAVQDRARKFHEMLPRIAKIFEFFFLVQIEAASEMIEKVF